MLLGYKQAALVTAIAEGRERLHLVGGSIRGGKSHGGLFGYNLWTQSRDRRIAYGLAAPTRDALEFNVIEPLCKIAEDLGLSHYENRQRGWLNIEGIQHRYYTASSPRTKKRIGGATLGGLFIDEIASLDYDWYQLARSRCSVRGAKIIATFNPEGPAHWVKKNLVDRADSLGGRTWHFTFDDNPTLPEEVKASYKQDYSGIFYDRMIRGLWAAGVGLIYPRYTVEAPPNERPVDTAAGFDYAISGIWACVLFQKFREAGWYAVGEIRRDATGTETRADKDLIAILKDFLPRRGRGIICYADAAMYNFVKKQIWEAGLSFRYPDKHVVDGLRTVDARLSSQALKVAPACTHLIDELDSYTWDEEATKKGKDEPVKVNDHSLDGTRYFVTGLGDQMVEQPGYMWKER